jgi:hypothetical protein
MLWLIGPVPARNQRNQGEFIMRRISRFIALAGPLALAACVVPPPAGPSVMALPGKDKSFEAFQQDDGVCRQYAFQQNGGVEPANAATQSAVGSAVVGTALGAAAGAAIGSVTGQMGAGAAIGGATGLVAGSAVGAGNAQVSAAELQRRYDMIYTQCMYSKGDTVQSAPAYGGYPASGPYAAYPYPGPYYYPAPGYYYGPGVVIDGGWGWGWGGWHGGWRR